MCDVYALCTIQTSVIALNTAELVVTVRLTNADLLAVKSTAGTGHTCVLLIADDDNHVVYKAKVRSILIVSLFLYVRVGSVTTVVKFTFSILNVLDKVGLC